MVGTDCHVTIRTPKNDHNSDSDHPTDSSNTITCDDKLRESESSVNFLILDSKTPIFLLVLIGLKIVFIDIFVPFGAVCSDFWQVLNNIIKNLLLSLIPNKMKNERARVIIP